MGQTMVRRLLDAKHDVGAVAHGDGDKDWAVMARASGLA
jgi:hypothetical protein